jgi:hypothetical protein
MGAQASAAREAARNLRGPEYNHSALITADSLIHLFYHQSAESYGQYYIGLGITFEGYLKPLSMRPSRRINEHYKGMACPFYGIKRETGTEYHVIKEPSLEVEGGHRETNLRELDDRRHRPACICKDCNIRFYPDTSRTELVRELAEVGAICSICLRIRQATFHIFNMAGVPRESLPRDLMTPADITPTSQDMGPRGAEINGALQGEYEDNYKRMVALLTFIQPEHVIKSLPQLQIISENILKLKERDQYSGNPSDDSTPPHDSYLEIDPPTRYTTLLSKLQACRREERQIFFNEIITECWGGCVIHQSSEEYTTIEELTGSGNYGDYCNLSRVYRKYTEVTWEKYVSLMKTIMKIESGRPIRGIMGGENDIERLLGTDYTEGMKVALCGFFFQNYMTDDRKGKYNSYKGQGFADIIDFLLLLHRFETKDELRKSVQLTRKIRYESNQPYAYPRSGCWAINIAGIEVRNLFRFNESGGMTPYDEETIQRSLIPHVTLVGTGQETDTKRWFAREGTDIRLQIMIQDCYREDEFRAAIKTHRIRYTQLRSAHRTLMGKSERELNPEDVTEVGEFLKTNEMSMTRWRSQAAGGAAGGGAPAPE